MRAVLKNHPVILLFAVLIIGLLVWGFWPQPVLVETVEARRAPLTITIEEEGRTRVIDRYVISAPVDGVACRVELDVGEPVEQNQELVGIAPLASRVLDPRSRAEAEAREAAAESALEARGEQARAAAAAEELADSELKRLAPLMVKGVISRETFERAETRLLTSGATRRSADFMVEVARYELAASRTALAHSAAISAGTPVERVPVRSPVSGRILKVFHECEGPVRTGDPLLEVGDPSALEVEVDVLSADAVKIKRGMTVQFDRWGGEQPLSGTVRTVEPIGFTKVSALGVEEQRVLIISDFTSPLEQWQRLGDGYRVEARFILWHQEGVLQVPASSLFRHKNGWAVFIVEDQRAKLRTVKIGWRNGLVAQVLEGVRLGQDVVNHPSDDVEDGTRVTERNLEN